MSTNLLLRIRPRLRRAFKFCRHNTELCFRRCPLSRACHLTVTKSPLGLFKEISPKRNFFQRDPRRGSLSFHAALRHENSLLLRSADASRGSARGSAPTPREPLKRLDPNFVPRYGSEFYVNITRVVRNRISTTEIRISRQLLRAAAEFNFTARKSRGRRRRGLHPKIWRARFF